MKDTGTLLPQHRCHCIPLLHCHSSGFTQFIHLQDPLRSQQNIIRFCLFFSVHNALAPQQHLLAKAPMCSMHAPCVVPRNRAVGHAAPAALDSKGPVYAHLRHQQQRRSGTASPAVWSSPATKPRTHRVCPTRSLRCAVVKHKGIYSSCFSV